MKAEEAPFAICLLRVEEVAERLSFSIRSVRALIAAGLLPIVRVGARAVRVDQADLAAYIDGCRQRGDGAARLRNPARSQHSAGDSKRADAARADRGSEGDGA